MPLNRNVPFRVWLFVADDQKVDDGLFCRGFLRSGGLFSQTENHPFKIPGKKTNQIREGCGFRMQGPMHVLAILCWQSSLYVKNTSGVWFAFDMAGDGGIEKHESGY